MRRKLLNFAAAISLLLCAATLVLWVDGIRTVDMYGQVAGQSISAGHHRLNAVVFHRIVMLTVEKTGGPYSGFQLGSQFVTKLGQFGYVYSRPGSTFRARVYFPAVWAVVLFSMLPTTWLIAWRMRGRRRTSGLCSVCSYDLTGNTSGVCPECGTPVADKAGARA